MAVSLHWRLEARHRVCLVRVKRQRRKRGRRKRNEIGGEMCLKHEQKATAKQGRETLHRQR